MTLTPNDRDWCTGWLAGFAAAAYLYSGHYAEYAENRDTYLTRKGWEHPMDAHDRQDEVDNEYERTL